MQVVDLTHFLSQGMPVYPGTEGPRFESANTYERDGFQETRMTMYTHTGTPVPWRRNAGPSPHHAVCRHCSGHRLHRSAGGRPDRHGSR